MRLKKVNDPQSMNAEISAIDAQIEGLLFQRNRYLEAKRALHIESDSSSMLGDA